MNYLSSPRRILGVIAAIAPLFTPSGNLHAAPAPKPLMRDFMGINGHLAFKPELYKPTCSLVRNYHPMPWDLMDDTSVLPKFPVAKQSIIDGPVNWEKVYGSWKAQGFTVDACLQFDGIKLDAWKNMEKDAYAYGKAFASCFGPSNMKLVTSAEIGNEPVNYDDTTYRKIFESMAKGLRAGDPKLKIVTTTSAAKQPDKYSKTVNNVKGLENLYDVLNIHTYSMITGYPTWERVYPEHPDIPYLKVIDEMVEWRDANARGKEIWVTEFGYDACSKPAPATGTFSKWISSTETQQAQWLVRSFLLMAAMDVQRAYMYYYDDKDEPQFHASSGITRNFVPKPAYHSMAHLNKTLGDYRFTRVLSQEKGEMYAYEFMDPKKNNEAIWVFWSPTGANKETTKKFPLKGARVVKAERMPLKEGAAETVTIPTEAGSAVIPLTESPLYVWLSAGK